jgi:hypothetical protein
VRRPKPQFNRVFQATQLQQGDERNDAIAEVAAAVRGNGSNEVISREQQQQTIYLEGIESSLAQLVKEASRSTGDESSRRFSILDGFLSMLEIDEESRDRLCYLAEDLGRSFGKGFKEGFGG